ncbi:hypothetical protein IJG14_05065 [bacterium]|nr:hypothetical protein [bacterium]
MIKKFLYFCLIFCNILVLPVKSEEASKIFKFEIINEPKSKIEFARVLLPQDFNLNYNIFWIRNLEAPVLLSVSAVSNNRDIKFFYSSKITFSDNGRQLDSFKLSDIDSLSKITKQNFQTIQDYVLKFIKKENPSAQNIQILSSQYCQKDIKEYLTEEMYKKIENLKLNTKTDIKSSKIDIINPNVEPYTVTYKFEKDGKKYKQTVITMLNSLDFEYTKKTKYNIFEKNKRKIWTVTGLYSYCAEIDIYDEYYNDFIIFAANTAFNQKAYESIELVKKQMLVELNPIYRDVHTNSPLKNMPSELFRRYYKGGLANYSEDKTSPMQKPSLEQIRWYVNIIEPLNSYKLKNLRGIGNQIIYIPKKFKYIYYSPVNNYITVDTNKNKLSGNIKLKQTKIKYIDKK